jgi:hypothetical protein
MLVFYNNFSFSMYKKYLPFHFCLAIQFLAQTNYTIKNKTREQVLPSILRCYFKNCSNKKSPGAWLCELHTVWHRELRYRQSFHRERNFDYLPLNFHEYHPPAFCRKSPREGFIGRQLHCQAFTTNLFQRFSEIIPQKI